MDFNSHKTEIDYFKVMRSFIIHELGGLGTNLNTRLRIGDTLYKRSRRNS